MNTNNIFFIPFLILNAYISLLLQYYMRKGGKDNPISLDQDPTDRQILLQNARNKQILQQAIMTASPLDICFAIIKTTIPGDLKLKNLTLNKAILRFYQQNMGINLSNEHFHPKPQPNYEDESTKPNPKELILYGCDFLTTNNIRDRFKTPQTNISKVYWINDSTCKLCFHDEMQAQTVLNTMATDFKQQQDLDQVSREWFTLKPYFIYSFQRRLYLRYATTLQADPPKDTSNRYAQFQQAQQMLPRTLIQQFKAQIKYREVIQDIRKNLDRLNRDSQSRDRSRHRHRFRRQDERENNYRVQRFNRGRQGRWDDKREERDYRRYERHDRREDRNQRREDRNQRRGERFDRRDSRIGWNGRVNQSFNVGQYRRADNRNTSSQQVSSQNLSFAVGPLRFEQSKDQNQKDELSFIANIRNTQNNPNSHNTQRKVAARAHYDAIDDDLQSLSFNHPPPGSPINHSTLNHNTSFNHIRSSPVRSHLSDFFMDEDELSLSLIAIKPQGEQKGEHVINCSFNGIHWGDQQRGRGQMRGGRKESPRYRRREGSGGQERINTSFCFQNKKVTQINLEEDSY